MGSDAMTGPELRRAREAAGVSAAEVATAAFLSRNAVLIFERGGVAKPRPSLLAAYAKLDRLPKSKRPLNGHAKKRPPTRRRTETGYALRGIRPGALDPGAPEASWNGVFDQAWSRDQLEAWIRDGVTVAEMRQPGRPEAATSRVYLATYDQLRDLVRRLTVALTGKNLQG